LACFGVLLCLLLLLELALVLSLLLLNALHCFLGTCYLLLSEVLDDRNSGLVADVDDGQDN